MIPLGRNALVAILRRPDLWSTALRVGFRLAVPEWWRHWPPRPLPDPAYLRFRLETMYGTETLNDTETLNGVGGPGAAVSGEDLVGYVEWCRRPRGRAR